MVVYAGWDEHLFTNHKLVAVDPLTSAAELELLKVLTKTGTFGVVNRGPFLEYTGFLTDLTKSDERSGEKSREKSGEKSGESSSSAQTSLEAVLQARQSQKIPDVLAAFKNTTRIMASVLKFFKGEATADRSMTVKMESLTTDFIKQEDLTKLVKEGRWKPDPKNPQMPKNWDGVLWVITEIKYATKIIIGHSTKSVTLASMRPKSLVPVPDSVDLPVEVKLDVAKDGTTVYTAPENGRFPLGFKAMRLEYDQAGNLLAPGGISPGLGEQLPIVRADDDAWLNPDKEPDFHMRGLFTREPERPLECLPIVAGGELEAAAAMGS